MRNGGDVSESRGQIHLSNPAALPVYLLDLESGLSDQLGSSARSEKADIVLDETFGKIKKSGFVKDREYSLAG